VLSARPSTPQRATQEITLRASLARALMAAKGYTPEVEQAYANALQLFEGQPLPQLFPVLRSLASFYNFRAEFDKGAQVGREILRLAEQENDPGMLVDGHLLLGMNLAFLGDLHTGLHHLDTAIHYFHSQPYRLRPFRLGNNPGVACYTTSAFLLWMLGYPERAAQRADDAVALARDLEHPFSLAYALFHSGFLYLWRREPELVKDRAQGVLHVVEDHDFSIWRAVGTCLLGAGNAASGHAAEGLAQIRHGLHLYQGLTTPPVFWPLLLFLHAGAHLPAGRPAEGLPIIDEAIQIASQAPVTTMLPEFRLLRGDLLLEQATSNVADAEACFQQAFDDAQRLDARMPQLRAAVRLSRLQRDQNHADQANPLLREAYDSFTEGFATADLADAANLLRNAE
jgi:tetratricopeptide (TPR) repeat protein